MNTIWKTSSACLVILFLCGSGSVSGATKPATKSAREFDGKHQKDKSRQDKTTAEMTAEIDALLKNLQKSLTEGKAQAAASMWAENAIFIDEAGAETHGRNALQQRFESLFKSQQSEGRNRAIELEVERVSFPSSNVALIVGQVNRLAGNERSAASRFSMTAEKLNQQWLISQATETQILQDSDAHAHLSELEWLLGTWKTVSPSSNASIQVEWAPGKKFLRATCISSSKETSEQKTDTQIIGWDERSGSIVSWYFGYYGNFSYGKWRREGSNWLVDVAGVNSDGTVMRETNVLSNPGIDRFMWQSTERISAGKSLPDSQILTVEKINSVERNIEKSESPDSSVEKASGVHK